MNVFRNQIFFVLILAISTLCLVQLVQAEEEEKDWAVDLSTSVFTDYMFRGFNYYDGVSIQPSIKASYSFGDYGTVSALLWMHLSAEGDRRVEKFTELDETLTYDYTYDIVTLSIGNSWYTYPDDDDDIPSTGELFAGLIFDAPLEPAVYFYHDWKEFDNQYYELSIGHTIETASIGDGNSLRPFAAFGFAANSEKVYEDDGLVQVTIGTLLNIALGDFVLTPSINYTIGIDDFTVDEFWSGMTLTRSF